MSTITTPNEILAAGASQFAMYFNAYRECSPEIQEIIHDMTAIAADPDATADEKRLASQTLIEALFPALTADVHDFDETLLQSPASQQIEKDLDREEETFAERLRALMAENSVTQERLAELTGVSQPAIANILARQCRPQRRTVVKIAAALGVEPSELWTGFVQ